MIRYRLLPPLPPENVVSQSMLRRRIAILEVQQQHRIELVAGLKKELETTVELHQRELDNLRAQVEIS